MLKSKYLMKPLFSIALVASVGLHQFSLADNQALEINAEKLKSEHLQSLIHQMSHEEKAAMLNGIGMDMVVNIGSIDGRVPGAGGETFTIERLDIPSIIVSDGPAGLRIDNYRDNGQTYFTTAFPSVTGLASSWNNDLLYKVGQAMGNETKEYGVDVLLAPGINIQRNPLNGRNFEYFSEDPLLSGMFAIPFIDGVQSLGIGTAIKHYAANNAETNRLYSNSLVSERAMREIYLRGFEIAIKASKPWTVMTAYNKLNGTYTNAHKELNTQILRDEWGFDGLVMTDWFSGYANAAEMNDDNFSSDVVAQIESGNDLLMPGDAKQNLALFNALEEGRIDPNKVDTSIERVLKLVYMSPSSYQYQYSDKPDLKSHAQLAREAIAESLVLLKNEGKALPIKVDQQKIALFNAESYDIISGGTGSSDLDKEYLITISEGLELAGATLDQDLKALYLPHVKQSHLDDEKARETAEFAADELPLYANIPFLSITDEIINDSVKKNDVAIMTLGRNAGETHDQTMADYYFSAEEVDLLKRISEAYHQANKPVIVLLNIPGAVDVTRWEKYADAVLVVWYPGQEAGNGIADVITGKVTPSAKLTQTFPLKYEDLPSAKSFFGLPKENPTDIYYDEGIYVGYRYFDTFDVEPAYPFGFGLSYTTFGYDDINVMDNTNDIIKVSVKVTNKGDVAGAEVVQLYVQAPQGELDKPQKELKAYAKTAILAPGESEVVVMNIDRNLLASFNPHHSAWIIDPGTYTILVGSSSRDIHLTAQFKIDEAEIVETVTPAFQEKHPFTELNPLKNAAVKH